MGRDAKDARALRRAHDDAEKGLKRTDAALATAALLRLPAADRDPLLPRIAALFRTHVRRLHRAGEWRALESCSRLADREPRLVAPASTPLDEETVWALFWGCVRCAQWDAGSRWLAALQPRLAERAPRLLAALESLIAGRGVPATDALEGALPSVAPDPRLGLERRAGGRPTVAPPQTVAEAEPAVLALLVATPWKLFAESIESWLASCPPPVAEAVGRLAAGLATRELLRRLVEGEGPAEPAVLLASIVDAASAPPALEADATLALRALGSRLAERPLGDLAHARALAVLAEAVALYPERRAWAVESLVRVQVAPEASEPLLRLFERWIRARPEAATCMRALALWAARPRCPQVAPDWLAAALATLVREGDALAAWFSGAGRAHEVLDAVGFALPPALAEAMLEQAWKVGDERTRSELAHAVGALFERLRVGAIQPPGGWTSSLQRELFLELLRHGADLDASQEFVQQAMEAGLRSSQLEEVLQLVGQAASREAVPPVGRALWQRWQERLVPLHLDFLRTAIRLAASDGEALAAARQYGSRRPGAVAWMEAITCAEDEGRRALGRSLLDELLRRHAESATELARALLFTRQHGVSLELAHELGRALLLAAVTGTAPPSPELAAALDLAYALALMEPRAARRRGRKPRKPRARKQSTARRPRAQEAEVRPGTAARAGTPPTAPSGTAPTSPTGTAPTSPTGAGSAAVSGAPPTSPTGAGSAPNDAPDPQAGGPQQLRLS